MIMPQQGYLSVKQANLDSVKGRMQRVLEHSKVTQVLLLSFWALSVDMCAYPTCVLFSTPQEKRKMRYLCSWARKLLPRQKACLPPWQVLKTSFICEWRRLSSVRVQLAWVQNEKVVENLGNWFLFLCHFLKAGMTSAGPQLLLDSPKAFFLSSLRSYPPLHEFPQSVLTPSTGTRPTPGTPRPFLLSAFESVVAGEGILCSNA